MATETEISVSADGRIYRWHHGQREGKSVQIIDEVVSAHQPVFHRTLSKPGTGGLNYFRDVLVAAFLAMVVSIGVAVFVTETML